MLFLELMKAPRIFNIYRLPRGIGLIGTPKTRKPCKGEVSTSQSSRKAGDGEVGLHPTNGRKPCEGPRSPPHNPCNRFASLESMLSVHRRADRAHNPQTPQLCPSTNNSHIVILKPPELSRCQATSAEINKNETKSNRMV